MSNGWIDVTATLDPATTPVYEGDAPMKFDFLKDMRKGDGFTLSVYSLGAHSGTHIDAPMHFIRDGAPIDRVPIEALIGPARVIDIPRGRWTPGAATQCVGDTAMNPSRRSPSQMRARPRSSGRISMSASGTSSP